MREKEYYSVRMRAAKNGSHEQGGKHISGGELLATYGGIKEGVESLLEKGLTHSRGKPDFIQIQVETMKKPVKQVPPLPVTTNQVRTKEQGQSLAKDLLMRAGVSELAIDKAYKEMTKYSVMRGAVLIDAASGERIDGNKERGVRVSRMDWKENHHETWAYDNHLSNNQRMKEAMALAVKVCNHPATAAELCWSDDPDYVTGYVASKKLGYQRITKLKNYGEEQGCRIFFVEHAAEIPPYIHYLEKHPLFVQWRGNDD